MPRCLTGMQLLIIYITHIHTHTHGLNDFGLEQASIQRYRDRMRYLLFSMNIHFVSEEIKSFKLRVITFCDGVNI